MMPADHSGNQPCHGNTLARPVPALRGPDGPRGQTQRLPRKAVRLDIAMTGNPYQQDLLKTLNSHSGLRNQDDQPGNLRAFRTTHIAHGDIAVTVQLQPPGTRLGGDFQRQTQRMQLRFVVAAGLADQNGSSGVDSCR